MEEAEIIATFGPAAGDRATLSKASRMTMEALYQHPLSHNVQWSDVVALFAKLGTVDHKSSNEIAFSIGGKRHQVRKPHSKELTAADVMAFRHLLSRSGWSPEATSEPGVAADTSYRDATAIPVPPDLLVVVEHHKAKLYHLDIRSADLADHVIRPYDPHHFLQHLSHKDQSREQGQRTPEDHAFYERIAQAISPNGRIVLIGHGKGHSNVAHHLTEYLRLHHPETFQEVVCEVVADLSSLTAPQLLNFGRRALTV